MVGEAEGKDCAVRDLRSEEWGKVFWVGVEGGLF